MLIIHGQPLPAKNILRRRDTSFPNATIENQSLPAKNIVSEGAWVNVDGCYHFRSFYHDLQVLDHH